MMLERRYVYLYRYRIPIVLLFPYTILKIAEFIQMMPPSPFEPISPFVNLTTSHVYVNVATPSAVPSTCSDLDMLTTGTWNQATKQWQPKKCSFTTFDKTMVDQCLGNKSISFYGDSTLRNIANELIRLEEATITLDTWAPGPFYRNGGGSISNNGKMAMWWTPSAYFQQPARVGTLETDDISIISIGVWDMGQYYRGINSWFTAIHNVLLGAAEKRKRNNGPVYVMHLHRIYASKCRLKNTDAKGQRNFQLCQECNKEEAMFAFRDALAAAVKCVQAAGYNNLHLVDTFGITDSSFAEEQSDGVHFHEDVTNMELQVLLAAICHGLEHPTEKMDSIVCPTKPDFEAGKRLDCKAH